MNIILSLLCRSINLPHCCHIFPWSCVRGGCLHVILYMYYYHHYANVSETTVRYILSSVCLRLSTYTSLYLMLYMRLSFFSLTLILRKYVLNLIIIISEIWIISHCLGLGHETMVCTVCLAMSLYVRGPMLDECRWAWQVRLPRGRVSTPQLCLKSSTRRQMAGHS